MAVTMFIDNARKKVPSEVRAGVSFLFADVGPSLINVSKGSSDCVFHVSAAHNIVGIDGGVTKNLVLFTPFAWGGLDMYMVFADSFKKKRAASYLKGIRTNMLRAHSKLVELPGCLVQLSKDREDFLNNGHSSFSSMSDFTDLYESAIQHIVTAADGLKSFICMEFMSNSASDLFEKDGVAGFYRMAGEQPEKMHEYGVPEEIVCVLHDYFFCLKEWNRIRNNAAHGVVGFSVYDNAGGFVKYQSGEVSSDDANGAINNFFYETNIALLGRTFHILMQRLKPCVKSVPCIVVDGYLFYREVVPSTSLSFADGVCKQKAEMGQCAPVCPAASKCGAYRNLKSS